MLISHRAPAQLDTDIPLTPAVASSTTSRTYFVDLAGQVLAAAVSDIAASTSLLSGRSSSNGDASNVDGDADIDPASDYVPPEQRPETYIITVLFALIFIVGVLGNGTLVIIFFRHRSMRNIPNTYILSLALADLLVIIICVPLACIVYTQESWAFGAEMCRISESFKDISIGVSVFTLTALSGERYCAIVNPLRKLQTRPLTVFTATMIWMVAILLATPSFVVSDIQEIHLPPTRHNENLTIIVCTPFGRNRTTLESYSRYTVISKAFIYYLLPLSIIGALYILMAKRLHTSARDMPGETLGMQSRSQARARRHVARMVVAFVVVFFVCFFPYHLFELWFHLNPTAKEDFDDFWHAIRIIGFCASFLHSCVNPVALYCVSGVFRQHFNRYLCCLCSKRQPRIRQHSTATGVMDTSIMSMRRSTVSNYNRASLHINNNSNNTIGRSGVNGSGVGGGNDAGAGAGFHQQTSIQLHHSVAIQKNGSGSGGGGGSGSDKR
ncbi:neuropeptide CCHamide-2 receptor [Anastrepha obliqua]|uniref:neuropeptide CCHamide-2 receptor n=1 Tax=Anastrepha obliqua TaxID=95512 RepID=UPI0024095A76|nr:neuropeptide CCHamide-2 receptor [Anastrepha obliqua]